MRIAVLADIHGYSLALDTVLADLDRTGPYDRVVVAGDLCAVGPDPRGVIQRLRERDVIVLHGNTDVDIVTDAREGYLSFAAREIGPDGIEYLAGLAFDHRVTPPGGTSPDDDLLVVHANPHDVRRRLDPESSDRELREVLGDARFKAIAFGHIHVDYIRELDGRLLVDVSAVGNPKDGDLRCKYGVLTWDENQRTWSAEIRHLPYPLEETKAQIFSSNLPNPQKVFDTLVRASY